MIFGLTVACLAAVAYCNQIIIKAYCMYLSAGFNAALNILSYKIIIINFQDFMNAPQHVNLPNVPLTFEDLENQEVILLISNKNY